MATRAKHSAKNSAGILMWNRKGGRLRVLLVHPGGPYWAKKDRGAWTIPKGEYDPHEFGDSDEAMAKAALKAARREFFEETGHDLSGEPDSAFVPLGSVKQKAGKIVTAFAFEGDLDAGAIVSNTFEIEWPPKTGKRRTFPEVDRAEWFEVEEARERINEGQRALIARVASQ
jgi:predicted NUDIX family NTP pyrophosphohydrolase